jgi:hypothetical protein
VSTHQGTRPKAASAAVVMPNRLRKIMTLRRRPAVSRSRSASSRRAARRLCGVDTTADPFSAASRAVPRRTMVTEEPKGSLGSPSSTRPESRRFSSMGTR